MNDIDLKFSLKEFLNSRTELKENKEIIKVEKQLKDFKQKIHTHNLKSKIENNAKTDELINQNNLLVNTYARLIQNRSNRNCIKNFKGDYPKFYKILINGLNVFYTNWMAAIKHTDELKEIKIELVCLYIQSINDALNSNIVVKSAVLEFEKSKRIEFDMYEKLLFYHVLNRLLYIPQLVLTSFGSSIDLLKKQIDDFIIQSHDLTRQNYLLNRELDYLNKPDKREPKRTADSYIKEYLDEFGFIKSITNQLRAEQFLIWLSKKYPGVHLSDKTIRPKFSYIKLS